MLIYLQNFKTPAPSLPPQPTSPDRHDARIWQSEWITGIEVDVSTSGGWWKPWEPCQAVANVYKCQTWSWRGKTLPYSTNGFTCPSFLSGYRTSSCHGQNAVDAGSSLLPHTQHQQGQEERRRDPKEQVKDWGRSVTHRVSQPQHYGCLGPDNSSL